jgi:hypothetical protein
MKIVFSPQHDNRVTQVYITLQHVYQFIFHNYGMSYPQWHLFNNFFHTTLASCRHSLGSFSHKIITSSSVYFSQLWNVKPTVANF